GVQIRKPLGKIEGTIIGHKREVQNDEAYFRFRVCSGDCIWHLLSIEQRRRAEPSRFCGPLVCADAGYLSGAFAGTGNLAHPIRRRAIQETGPGGFTFVQVSAVRPRQVDDVDESLHDRPGTKYGGSPERTHRLSSFLYRRQTS